MCDWIGNIGAFETSFMYVQNFIILSWVSCYEHTNSRKELHYTIMGFLIRVWFMQKEGTSLYCHGFRVTRLVHVVVYIR